MKPEKKQKVDGFYSMSAQTRAEISSLISQTLNEKTPITLDDGTTVLCPHYLMALAELLNCSFIWNSTPEGDDFWRLFHQKLELMAYETGEKTGLDGYGIEAYIAKSLAADKFNNLMKKQQEGGQGSDSES